MCLRELLRYIDIKEKNIVDFYRFVEIGQLVYLRELFYFCIIIYFEEI